MKLKTKKVFAGLYETVYKGVLVEVEDAKRATEGELDGWYVRLNGRADDIATTKAQALEWAKYAIDEGHVTSDQVEPEQVAKLRAASEGHSIFGD